MRQIFFRWEGIELAQYNIYGECGIGHANMAALNELLFGMVSGVGPRNCVLNGRAHWHYLANMVEQCDWLLSRSANRV